MTVTLVGAQDRALDERLRATGVQPAHLPLGELAALAQPVAAVPDVLVLDLRGQAQVPPVLAAIRRHHPDTNLVVVTATLEPAFMLDAMRAGVTECVTDLAKGDLEAALARLASERTAPDTGEVFVLLGAKGGVGTTTAAVNLATALGKVAGAATLLLDLHLSSGDAALYLGVEPRFSVIDALENTHRLDVAYFRSLVERTKFGVDLLASSDRSSASPIDAPRIRTLIDFAARHYRYTVVDVPRSDTVVLDALEGANRIVVVANQELATVRGAARAVNTLRQRYGRDKVTVVLSRSDRRAEIGTEDLERAIGATVSHVLPSDYRLALDALNRGRPLVMESQSALAAAFVAYARDLSGVKTDAGATSGFLGLLRRRA
ncbi:MAG: AAA family ATPase [Acidobacteria bacterium]|nr:AAA family ATPase [Acidobacteriota bacterium]